MSLEERVAQLEALVQKQQAMILKSGEQIMKLSLSAQKEDIDDLDQRNKNLRSQVKLDAEEETEHISQDDMVQLVIEMQGQLDLVEKRSILRVENASRDTLSPLPNIGGEVPLEFPSTTKEFEALQPDQLVEIARFYELLPPDVEEIKALLTEGNIPLSSKEGKEAIETAKKQEDNLDIDDIFNQVARYLGVNSRRAL